MAQVDEAVRRVLLLKFRLGLFERPYTPVTSEKERFFRPQSMDIAARLAAESMVLLHLFFVYRMVYSIKNWRIGQ